MMKIGQLANKASVNVQTIRYYERRNLLFATERSEAGYRHYSDDALNRLRFIKRAQQLGFTLDEIHDLLTLQIDKPSSCQQVKERTESKLREVEEKICLLNRMQTTLASLLLSCEERQTTEPCPILEILSADGEQNENQ